MVHVIQVDFCQDWVKTSQTKNSRILTLGPTPTLQVLISLVFPYIGLGSCTNSSTGKALFIKNLGTKVGSMFIQFTSNDSSIEELILGFCPRPTLVVSLVHHKAKAIILHWCFIFLTQDTLWLSHMCIAKRKEMLYTGASFSLPKTHFGCLTCASQSRYN